jgi:hypothetical protein
MWCFREGCYIQGNVLTLYKMEYRIATQTDWDDAFHYGLQNSTLSSHIDIQEDLIVVHGLLFQINFIITFDVKSKFNKYKFLDCQFLESVSISPSQTGYTPLLYLEFVDSVINRFDTVSEHIHLSVTFASNRILNEVNITNKFKRFHFYGSKENVSKIGKVLVSRQLSTGIYSDAEISFDYCEIEELENNLLKNYKLAVRKSIVNLLKLINCIDSKFTISFSDISVMNFISSSGGLNVVNSSIDILSLEGQLDDYSLEVYLDDIKSNTLRIIDFSGISTFLLEKSKLDCLCIFQCGIKDIKILETDIKLVTIPIDLLNYDKLSIKGTRNEPSSINCLFIGDGNVDQKIDKSKSTIYLESLKIGSMIFESLINDGVIYISRVKFDSSLSGEQNITIDNDVFVYLDQSNISITRNIYQLDLLDKDGVSKKVNKLNYINDTLEVLESDLGKINMVSCDFSNMSLVFRASKITEIFLSGTEMPTTALGPYKYQQIAFGQLKKVYESRGDSVLANEYLAYELNAHYHSEKVKYSLALNRFKYSFKNISWDTFRWSSVKSKFYSTRLFLRYQFSWDIVTLHFNKHSNDFGASWVVALKWLLLFMLPIYVLHNLALGYEIVFDKDYHDNFWELVSLFPEFLFPIHKADYISEVVKMPVTNWSRIWDVVGRIVSGYLIYQMVQAFRKFGKK